MSMFTPAVTAWLDSHHGVISNETLNRLGVTVDQRRRLVTEGTLRRVVHGVYRLAGAPPTDLQRCAAVCAARSEFVVGLASAAGLWRVPGFDALVDVVEVVAPHGASRCSADWVRIYRVDVLPAEDVVTRADGIRLTSPPRTVVDLARVLDGEGVEIAIEWILHRRLCTDSTLLRVATRLESPGRPWIRRFLGSLDARMPGGPRESRWEQRVMRALRRRGVDDLESQVWHRLPGYGNVRFDLAIPAIRWVLEVDVHPRHRTTGGGARDRRRDRDARRVGWLTERVGEAELTTAFESTMDDVVDSIEQRRTEADALKVAGMWAADS